MSKITIIPFNETYFKILAEEGPYKELHEHFTVKSNQAVWRGKRRIESKIRLFNFVTKQMYVGLLPVLIEFCQKYGHELDTAGLDQPSNIAAAAVQTALEALSPVIDNKIAEIHDYQFSAVLRVLRNKRALILSPTGSGKSLILYLVVRILQKMMNEKILIIVPTTNLITQMWGDFAEYSSKQKWSPLNHCHKIYEGQQKHSNKQIYISTWQSLKDLPREYFEQFGAIIGDEAHMYQAKCAKYIIGSCVNAKYKIGTTATLKDSKCHIMVLQGLFGEIFRTAKTTELIDKGVLSPLKIECILLNHPQQIQMNYWDEIAYLIENEQRNKFICNLAISLEGNTIVLFQYVKKHGYQLYESIKAHKNINGRNVYFIAGEIDMDVREEIRQILEKEENAIVVASFMTFSFGVSIRRLHNVILASPSKDRIRIMQSIGRELRLHPTKQKAFLFDVADNLSYSSKSKTNYTFQHFIQRLKVYFEEKFEYHTHEIELKGS